MQLTDFGGPGRKPEGRITEILGHVNDPGTDILSLVRAYGLAESFPEDVMEELKTIPDELETEAAPEGKRFVRICRIIWMIWSLMTGGRSITEDGWIFAGFRL